jgi:hypothetical protein
MVLKDLTLEELAVKSNAELLKINDAISEHHMKNKNWLEKVAIPVMEENEQLEVLNSEIIRILAKRRNIIE